MVWVTAWLLSFSIAGCADNPSPFDPSRPESSADLNSPRPDAEESTVEQTQAESAPNLTSEPPASTTNSESDVWSKLQQAETHYVVLVRHALAPGTGDPANFELGDCSTQRNLSDEGRAQARRTGEAFKQRGVVVRLVLSSQWCRCLETAELMDVGPVEPFPPLNSFFSDRARGPAQTAQVREFMREQHDTQGVTVMVTHFVNIGALSEADVSSGEMVVMQVNDQDQLEVVGRINAL